MIERKVDHKDYKQIMEDKLDKNDTSNFAKNDDIMVIRMQNDDILKQVDLKLNRDLFVSFDQSIQDKVTDILK